MIRVNLKQKVVISLKLGQIMIIKENKVKKLILLNNLVV